MLAPKLRFKQDIGKVCPFWELRRLGDIADVYQPQTISQSDLTPQGFDVYGANGIIGKYDKFNHEHEQVIVTCRGSTCGAVTFTKAKSWITGNAMVLNVDDNKEIQKKFLYYYMLQTKLDYLITGSGQPQITGSIKKHPINIPNTEEQQKIATFLTAVDTRISLMQQKHTLLQQYKKGVMQQIFSQKTRFRRDDGKDFADWEEHKIGDLGNIVGGGTPDTIVEDYWNGGINWFTPTELKSKYVNDSVRKISQSGLKNSSAKLLPIGTVLLTSRANIGDVSIALKECTTNQGFQSLIVNESNDIEFCYYLLNNLKNEFLCKASGSTFMEISKSELEKITFLCPTKSEQKKISLFLATLDTKIARLQTQIDQAKNFNQGLLQQMFV